MAKNMEYWKGKFAQSEGNSPFTKNDDWKDALKKSKTNIAKKDSINNVINTIQKKYYDLHGSSSGGTDEQWKKYQNQLNEARKGYSQIK